MRKLIYFFLALLVLLPIKITANIHESYLIRRAYIDVLGVVPTTQEIEWYCVYNKNGYKLAIDWLLTCDKQKWFLPAEYSRILLLSSEYKNLPKIKIPKEQVYKNLLYVTGSPMEVTTENIHKASKRLVNNAIASSNGDSEIIDYMCDALMSRSSNLEEINKLTSVIKNSSKPENETWMNVLEEILELEDVNSK